MLKVFLHSITDHDWLVHCWPEKAEIQFNLHIAAFRGGRVEEGEGGGRCKGSLSKKIRVILLF